MIIENLHNIENMKIVNTGSKNEILHIKNCSKWYKVDIIGFKQVQCQNFHYWVGEVVYSTGSKLKGG